MVNMEMKAVSSSHISAVGYEPDSQTLRIRFTSGKEYEYTNVPKSVYEGMMSAASVGRYFHASIREFYQAKKV